MSVTASDGLRTRVLRGGVFLVVRQALGTVLGFAAVMLIVRAIGPAEYGLAMAAIGMCRYVLDVVPLGIGGYLVRQGGELAREDLDQAFTCLLVSGLAGLVLALAAVPLIAAGMAVPRFAFLVAVAFGVVPFSAAARFPLALLERALEFRRIAFIELVSQVSGHAVALAMTGRGHGALALVAGFWTREVVALTLLVRAADDRPRLRWEGARALKVLRIGLAFGASGWVWQVGNFFTPLVVSRLAGPEVLGIVSLTNRCLESLNLVAVVAGRLGFAALARIQGDREKLSRACSDAMVVQVLSIGTALWLFGMASRIAVPYVLDARWSGLLAIYPYLALGTLVAAGWSFHNQVLHVLGRSWNVTVYLGLRVAISLAGLAVFLPSHGLLGYGYGEMLAFLVYPLVHAFVARAGVRPRYALPFAFQAIFGLALFHRDLGWPLALAPFAIALWPGTWRIVAEHVRSLRGRAAARRRPESTRIPVLWSP